VLCGWGELEAQLDDLRATLYIDGASPIRAKIKQIIPEYSYPAPEVCPFPEDSQELRKSAMGA
jgi:hypothetical protein